ncbi:MAG: hypothetical protein M1817_005643 [Caeruleum heppii]|nr:MAG: hypothetical protein M1817_005643 [Caeruleum heppii]
MENGQHNQLPPWLLNPPASSRATGSTNVPESRPNNLIILPPLPPHARALEAGPNMGWGPHPNPRHVIDLTSDEPDTGPRSPFVYVSRDASTRQRRPLNPTPDVIDVDALPDSPEVEISFARRLQPTPSRHDAVPPRRPQHTRPDQQDTARSLSGHGSGTGTTSESPLARSTWRGGLRGMLGRLAPFGLNPESQASTTHIAYHPPLLSWNQHLQIHHARSQRRPALDVNAAIVDVEGFVPPGLMPYDVIALTSDEPPRYEAPRAARPGYTRTPEKGDAIVCPNCGDELGIGDTNDKRSVWFVKGCGHVFCGECTKNRTQASRKHREPRSGRVGPFKTCPVCHSIGVKTSVGAKSMTQVFL